MSSIQGSINQLLGMGAAASAYYTQQAAHKYAAQRGAEYEKSYQAQLEAAKTGYTKSGAKSRSKAAKEAQAQVEATTPGAGSKAPWNKDVEAQLKAKYDKDVDGLQERTAKGLTKLKEANLKAKQGTYKQFGDYEPIAPEILKKLSPSDRWKIQAEQKLKQQQAFNSFIDSLKGGK